MKEVIISLATILIISIAFNIYHSRKIDTITDELSQIKIERVVELDEFNKAIEKNRVAMQELEIKKAKVVTKYIPISTGELKTCEQRVRAIESSQKMFFEVR